MNYNGITEKYLYNYRPLKASIENMKKEINDLNYYICSSLKLDNIGGIGYKGSITEMAAINIQEKKNNTRFEIIKLENRIDRSIEVLSEIEKYIIEEKYFEGQEWWKIAYELRYSERWCKELRRRALIRIAISLFGEKAMKEEIKCG